MTFGLSACSEPGVQNGQTNHEAQTRTIIDVFGREVEIPVEVESIIAIGVGAPRIAAYLDVMDLVVGGEAYMTQDLSILRDYNPVHHAFLRTLPIVGAGGGSGENNGFPEKIIMVAPDVIIAGFDREAADELQSQTAIPVVSVRHTTGLANESFQNAMGVFAEVVGAQERCEEILDFINYMKNDLDSRTRDVPANERLRAYAGAVTFDGRRGFAGTYSNFGIFDAINAVNVAQVPHIAGFYEASLESIILWDPDVIFLDPGNMDLVNSEFAANPNFFNSLRAVGGGRVYAMPAFNHAGTNITYAFINAYYAGTVLFPEQFADVDITEKAGEILTMFLGENIFEIMAANGLFYGQMSIGN
jgi:iron complex transport system substrate-binding protein